MAVDWLKIKNDYINGLGSYRKLAEKYGVNKDSIALRAKAEGWKELREKQTDKIQTETIQKVAEKIAEKEADRVARVLTLSDQLTDRIERAIRELDRAQVTNKTKTKVIEYKNGKRPDKPTKEIVTETEEILAVSSIIDRKGLQQVATALKAVWDIAGAASDQTDDVEDDGLLEALGSNAEQVFGDGDDSGMLPEEADE